MRRVGKGRRVVKCNLIALAFHLYSSVSVCFLAPAAMSSGPNGHPAATSHQRDLLLGEAASLDDQEYLELMEQLTDFNPDPSKPKSRLVHELNVQMSKDESLLDKPEVNSFQSRNRKIKQANLKQLKNSSQTDQRVDRCSSLQDLADTASPSSQDSHARKKSSKSKRANSFSADSKSQIKVKSGQNSKRNSKTQPSSPCPPDLLSNSSKKTAKDSNNNHSSTSSNVTCNTGTAGSITSSGDNTCDTYHPTSSSSSSSSGNQKSNYSFNTIDRDAQVEFALGDSSSTQPPLSSLSCDHSTLSSTGVTKSLQSTNLTSTNSDADDTGEGVLESQDYRRRLQLVNVNYLKENTADTNSLFKLSNLVAGPLCENSCRSIGAVDRLFDQKDPCNNDSEIASLTASSNRQSAHQNKANLKKKKKQDVPCQKAENIPGHIGYKDVDFLAKYVIGMDGQLDSVVRGKDKKAPNGPKKRPERSNSQQTDSQDKSNSDDEKEKASSSTQLSPKHSSLEVEDLTGRHAYSDDEKGYCSDQETGFQVMRSKNRRYNRHNRLPMTKGCIGNKVPVPISLSKTPSITSATSVSLNSRGYDSERECNYTQESVKKKSLRRKSISSVPHSQENSAENSDVDSSLSLPVASAAGRISYAQIAKATLVQSQTQQSTPFQGGGVGGALLSKKHQSIAKRATYNGTNDNEARSSSVNALASGMIATATDVTTVDVTSIKSDCSDENCKQPLKTSASCSEITVTCTVESPSPLRKQNSAPEAKSPVSNLPPVIICGDLKRNSNMDTDAQFTFGFFDDVIDDENYCQSNSSSGNSSASCSPESNQDKSIVSITSDHHQDVHLSFNYNEVLAYIRKAWVNSERTMQMQALSASEKSSWA